MAVDTIHTPRINEQLEDVLSLVLAFVYVYNTLVSLTSVSA